MVVSEFADFIESQEWNGVPETIISREGWKIEAKSEIWNLPIIHRKTLLDFRKISWLNLRWTLKKYVQHRIESVSSHAGSQTFNAVWREICSQQIANDLGDYMAEENLIRLFERRISVNREEHKLHNLYLPIQWYIWCAETYPELGFSTLYSAVLEGLTIPGNPKGEAVKTEDPDFGPLHKTLELPLLLKALEEDRSMVFTHIQERAALALSIAFGRNAANLTYLQNIDFYNLTPELETSCYVLKIPRIKKRQLDPRDDFIEEYVEPTLAQHIKALVHANENVKTNLIINGKLTEISKPLFINMGRNLVAIRSEQFKYSFNFYSFQITEMLKNFVSRRRIKSPITKQLLNLTVRRLRYTIATNLASEGISRRELARILDHSDTQHVEVYYHLEGNVVEHLDKAMAISLSVHINYLKGKFISSPEDAINGDQAESHLVFVDETNSEDQIEIGVCGKTQICHLDPPYSCYLCPKFQPYIHADHDHVLELLLETRNARIKKYDQARIGVQLDDVIYAVAQATKMSTEMRNGLE